MLQEINLEEVLFLDIETASAAPDFDQLDSGARMLWEEKSAFMRERKGWTLEESYSQAGIYAEFGKVICIGFGHFAQVAGERVFRVSSFSGDDEELVLRSFAELLESRYRRPFRILCAHNGKEFDFPYLCRRMLVNSIPLPGMLAIAGKKPWEVPHLDTMELWKFGDFKHYTSLKLLAHIFGIPTPKDDIDGSMVGDVYWRDKDLPRIDRYCRKDVVTLARIFQRYRGETALDAESVLEV